jgi:hypothetical protein
MKCPYLIGTSALRCEVENRLYMPSRNQISEYCMSSKYKACPLYLYVRDEIRYSSAKDFVTLP